MIGFPGQQDKTSNILLLNTPGEFLDTNLMTAVIWAYRDTSILTDVGTMAWYWGGNEGHRFFVNTAGNTCEFRAEMWSTTSGQWTAPWTWNNQLVHVAITYNFTSTSFGPTLYINGVSQGTMNRTVTPVGTYERPANKNLFVGGIGSNNQWAGDLGQFAVFDRILAADEILSMHDGVAPVMYAPAAYSELENPDAGTFEINWISHTEAGENPTGNNANGTLIRSTRVSEITAFMPWGYQSYDGTPEPPPLVTIPHGPRRHGYGPIQTTTRVVG